MDISWEDVRLFLAVADHGSLTEAARRLRVGQPTVSRRLAELEESLGYPLFDRSVEGTALTSQGERWLEPAQRMAEWAGELRSTAELTDSAPAGIVRMTAPTQRDLTSVHSFTHLNDAFVSKSYAKKLPNKPRMSDIDFIVWAPP